MSKRIAVLGLSGAGKSTFIDKLKEISPLLHLQGGELIKKEQAYREQRLDSSEALRTGNIGNNQDLMIAAFRREAAATELPVVFDGHCVIDNGKDLVEIPSEVFRVLNLDAICFLRVDPREIGKRRRLDVIRERPYRDIETLRRHQERAEEVAQRIAKEIQCPFIYVDNGKIDQLLELIG